MNSQSSRPLAIISGGSRGLGYHVARALVAQGFDIALIAKDAQRLEQSAAELREVTRNQNEEAEAHISTFACDLEQPLLVRELIGSINQSLPTPAVLVLAHGVMSEKMSKTLKTNDSEWRRVMAINLDSVFQLVNGIAPAMADARNGRVIIFSACLGRMSGPGNAGGLAPYRISKAVLTHSFATLHMKQDSALADFSLMQHAPTIHALIWVAPMHRVLQKKVQLLQSG